MAGDDRRLALTPSLPQITSVDSLSSLRRLSCYRLSCYRLFYYWLSHYCRIAGKVLRGYLGGQPPGEERPRKICC